MNHKNTRGYIAQHTLRVTDPQASVAFYRDKLGMRLLARPPQADPHTAEYYFLSFDDSPVKTVLALACQPEQLAAKKASHTQQQDGYWKIGITLGDVDLARHRLLAAGINVSPAEQFLDVGYLCHLNDPDGYCIELLQHRFAQHHQALTPSAAHVLGSPPTLAHITLRIKDPAASLRFYVEVLGMKLLSRQVIAPYRFTLYFLTYTTDTPPHDDIDAVSNREWLWQRPYTMLELQHIQGTEQGDFSYNTDVDTGFMGVSLGLPALESVVETLANHAIEINPTAEADTLSSTRTLTINDPDGYVVCLREA